MEHTLYFLPTDTDLPLATVDALCARVSPARRAKIAALRHAADARNALLAAAAVRLFAAEALGAENGQLQFARTDAGKPYLVGAPDFCFSLSHTDGALTVAVSPTPVGADIERIRRAPRGVAARFFAPEEQAFSAASDARFFEVWTRKEALAKRSGAPLAEVLGGCNVLTGSAVAETRIFRADSYVLAVASAAADAFDLQHLQADALAARALAYLAPID